MTQCRACENKEATEAFYPFCCGHCRAGYRATLLQDAEIDWVRSRLVQLTIRNSWSPRERSHRHMEPKFPAMVTRAQAMPDMQRMAGG